MPERTCTSWHDSCHGDPEMKPRVYSKRKGAEPAPAGAVYVGRPTAYGNPFEIGRNGTREECVQQYRDMLEEHPWMKRRVVADLRGKDLVCWCAPESCHADVLLEIANDPAALDETQPRGDHHGDGD